MIVSVEKGYEHRNAVLKGVCAAAVRREYHRPTTTRKQIVKSQVCFNKLP